MCDPSNCDASDQEGRLDAGNGRDWCGELDPVPIKKGAMVGLKATVMGDVVIGEGVIVPPETILLPKTRLADNEKIEP